MSYTLFYISADGPEEYSTWSVYREEYVEYSDENPIEGSTIRVGSCLSEEDADTVALTLQLGVNLRLTKGS